MQSCAVRDRPTEFPRSNHDIVSWSAFAREIAGALCSNHHAPRVIGSDDFRRICDFDPKESWTHPCFHCDVAHRMGHILARRVSNIARGASTCSAPRCTRGGAVGFELTTKRRALPRGGARFTLPTRARSPCASRSEAPHPATSRSAPSACRPVHGCVPERLRYKPQAPVENA